MYINKVQLYGNLTRDPETKALPSGQAVTNFSVATNRSFKDKEGKKVESVEYHNVVAFGKVAEIIGQYFKKGRPILVEGRLQTRSWDKDGVKQYRTEVVCDEFQFGASAPDGQRSAAPAAGAVDDFGDPIPQPDGAEIQYPDDEVNPEDIPF